MIRCVDAIVAPIQADFCALGNAVIRRKLLLTIYGEESQNNILYTLSSNFEAVVQKIEFFRYALIVKEK